MIRNISGKLTIPQSEENENGIYTDLELRLIGIVNTGTTLIETADVSTTNQYAFEYDDTGILLVRVRLIRISSGVVLSESIYRGVLPRSFKLDSKADPAYQGDFKNTAYLFDSGSSLLASVAANDWSLSGEISNGITYAPFLNEKLYHQNATVIPDGLDRSLPMARALSLYSLLYYVEKRPAVINLTAIADRVRNELMIMNNVRNLNGLIGRYKYTDIETAYLLDHIYTYFAYRQAGKLLNETYDYVSERLSNDIYRFYDYVNNKFYERILPNGLLGGISDNLEVLAMGCLFLIDRGEMTKAKDMLNRVESDYKSTALNVTGYKALKTDPSNKVWFEGSYLVALCYYKLDDYGKYNAILNSLNSTINTEDGSFRYGVKHNGGGYEVLSYKSVGATAWSYIASNVPEDIFSYDRTYPVLADIPQYYFNTEVGDYFYNSTCPTGTTAQPFYFSIPAGFYFSAESSEAAQEGAEQYITMNGQYRADEQGICRLPYTYLNTPRTGYWDKQGCGANQVGAVVSHTIPAGEFGSDLSQNHADALADAELFDMLQALASIQPCLTAKEAVFISSQTSVLYDGVNDIVSAVIKSDKVLAGNISVDYEYSTDAGATWLTGSTINVSQGTNSSLSFEVATVNPGDGAACQVRVVDVTPNTQGNQIYNWQGHVTLYGNYEQSALFIKDCGIAGITSASVVEYTIPENTYTSIEGQNHADAKAWKALFDGGQANANLNGACATGSIYYNTEQSLEFIKNDCGSGYEGSGVTYTVPAGTYSSSISVADANLMAQQDISTNGQAYANSQGTCSLNSATISLEVVVVRTPIRQGELASGYVKAIENVPANVAVDLLYSFNGSIPEALSVLIPAGSNQSNTVTFGPERFGNVVDAWIDSATPNPVGGKDLIW